MAISASLPTGGFLVTPQGRVTGNDSRHSVLYWLDQARMWLERNAQVRMMFSQYGFDIFSEMSRVCVRHVIYLCVSRSCIHMC